MAKRFKDRTDAGRQLAALLAHLRDLDTIVLALPRGGLPVAYEIANALQAPLDVLSVRKLGVPWHEEFAMGAIATGAPVRAAVLYAIGVWYKHCPQLRDEDARFSPAPPRSRRPLSSARRVERRSSTATSINVSPRRQCDDDVFTLLGNAGYQSP